MEKEAPESMATINMKPEYAPSEVYSSSEPPPAYQRPQSSSVHIAKIIAVTVVVCSVIMGSFLLASSYVRANASCRHLEQELEFLGEAAERIQGPLQPEALIQEAPHTPKHQAESLSTDEPPKKTKEIETNDIDDAESSSETSDSSETEENEKEVHLKLPVQMELEDVIGSLLEKNQRSKMNCIVEKKKSEEFVDHQPKTITLPFGLNLTTNPRFEKLSGERMVIICETGTVQRAQPHPQEDDDDDNQEEDTIMIQPVMIPIPQTPFHTHMPQQMRPIIQRVPEQMQMRPPMRPPMYQMESMRPPMPSMMQQQMPPMFQQQVPQIMQQQVPQIMQQQPPRQAPQFPRVQMQIQMQPQMPVQSQVPQMQQNELPPNPILHHIVQQIIAQKIIESQKMREEQMREEQAQAQTQQQQQEQRPQDDVEEERPHRFQVGPQMPQVAPQNMIGQRIPIPEEVLTQLNRLPNRDVIVAVAESDSEEAPQDVRFVQEQRQGATEMNGRQTFARGLPVDIPIAMMPQEQEPQEQEPQAASSEESRPHYVQPRSV